MRKLKLRPTFKSEAQEAAFWASHDSTEYIDYSSSRRMIFPKLKPSTETISLRLPKSLLDQIKTLANKGDVPYQTLLKIFVLERVQAELHLKACQGCVREQADVLLARRAPTVKGCEGHPRWSCAPGTRALGRASFDGRT